MPALLLLLGGPAGAGKSTVATAWCRRRPRAAHIELDEVRSLIVSGLANPQEPTPLQADQYRLSVEASIALARVFLDQDYDVAIDDALDPAAFKRYLRAPLHDLNYQIVVLRPTLAETLNRSSGRSKSVQERHTRSQHAVAGEWGPGHLIDTTEMTPEEAVHALEERLREMRVNKPGELGRVS